MQATEADPSSVYAWDVLGNVHLARGSFREARHAFEQGLNAKPDDVGLWFSLLVLQMSQGVGPGPLMPRNSQSEMRDSGLYMPAANLGFAITTALSLERGFQLSIDEIMVEYFLKMASPVLETPELVLVGALVAAMRDLKSRLRDYIQFAGERQLFSSLGGSSFVDSVVVLLDNLRSILGRERAQDIVEQVVTSAFTEFDPGSSVGQGIYSLASLLLIVRPEHALRILKRTAWSEPLAPLCHALAVHTDEDPTRFARLAPELREISEVMLQSLIDAESSWYERDDRSGRGTEP